MNYIDILVKIVIPFIGAVVAYFIVPLIKSKTSKEQRENIYAWVKIGVQTAEQIADLQGLKTGRDKKEYVQKFLADLGLKISSEELDAMIEAAVYELNVIQGELNKSAVVYNISTEDYKELGD